MTLQNLTEGIKKLLNDEYKKAGLKFDGKETKSVLPNVFVGFLPQSANALVFPYALIVLPEEITDKDGVVNILLSLCFGVCHDDRTKENNGYMDIFTLVERTKDILLCNRIIAESFKQTGDVRYGFDALSGQSVTASIGELEIAYETVVCNNFQN